MLNQVTIIGNLVKDAEVRILNNGKCMTTFCVAVSRNYKNSEGKHDADYIDCVAFEKVGEIVGRYFSKGDSICVTGEIQTRLYEDQEGKKHKQYVINVGKVYFTGNKRPASEGDS